MFGATSNCGRTRVFKMAVKRPALSYFAHPASLHLVVRGRESSASHVITSDNGHYVVRGRGQPWQISVSPGLRMNIDIGRESRPEALAILVRL